MAERFPGSNRNLKLIPLEGSSNLSDGADSRPLIPANDAYFHPLFAPYTQSSSVGRNKMQSLGFKPVKIVR